MGEEGQRVVDPYTPRRDRGDDTHTLLVGVPSSPPRTGTGTLATWESESGLSCPTTGVGGVELTHLSTRSPVHDDSRGRDGTGETREGPAQSRGAHRPSVGPYPWPVDCGDPVVLPSEEG